MPVNLIQVLIYDISVSFFFHILNFMQALGISPHEMKPFKQKSNSPE